MSYRGASKQFLDSQNVSIGDKIRVTKKDVSYEGMVLERAEEADDEHVVLKMASGYNMGVNITDSRIELLEKGEKPEIKLPPVDVEHDGHKRTYP